MDGGGRREKEGRLEEGGESRTEEEGRSEEGPAGGESREDGGGGRYRVQQGGGGDGSAEGGGVGDGGRWGRTGAGGEGLRGDRVSVSVSGSDRGERGWWEIASFSSNALKVNALLLNYLAVARSELTRCC